ncbi:MAG TPA: hypothetical protein EYN58_04905 [Candidatus Poseidoniales archaeon]|nr:MAG: hypothetical protein CXX81_20295 [Euryarchaeota archaeon]HHZ74508.1 hypothetical protein [Candidatus Poseidoniales archaeon]HIB23519.1 hypothetical protein [Candidatus Poseidoniales archaeon]HIB41282.1 hypothetical protein [Candidatus Poseidoniales archaeon]HIO57112.1 hypothetical protein [Candidatus Poseidoniales archaeon]
MVSDLRDEMRVAIFKREMIGAVLPRMILFGIIIVLWNIIEPYGFQLNHYSWFAIFSLFVLILVWNANKRTQSIMEKIDDIIDGKMDATELLEQYSGRSLPLVDSLFNLVGTNEELELLLTMTSEENEYAKDVDWMGREIYKTRGKDFRGPAKGQGADTFGEILPRVDAMTVRPEHKGIEGPLSKAEKMVEMANEIAADKALKDWEYAEASDPELIEAGIDKLGDLVASGHYKGPENKP